MTQGAGSSRAHGIDEGDLRRYADLILRCGANIEEGQKVLITGDVEHAYLIAALAERAYANGASLAETFYFDDRVLAASGAAAAGAGWWRDAAGALHFRIADDSRGHTLQLR